jgi:hypothetical protein
METSGLIGSGANTALVLAPRGIALIKRFTVENHRFHPRVELARVPVVQLLFLFQPMAVGCEVEKQHQLLGAGDVARRRGRVKRAPCVGVGEGSLGDDLLAGGPVTDALDALLPLLPVGKDLL